MRLNRFAFLSTQAHRTQTTNIPSDEIQELKLRVAYFKAAYFKSNQEPKIEPGSEPDYTKIFYEREILRDALNSAEQDLRDHEYSERQALKHS